MRLMLVPDFAIQLLYALTAVISLGFGVILWRNRDSTGALALCIAALGITVWTGALYLQTLAGPTWSREFVRLRFFGVVVNTAGTFVFALEYTGRERYVNRKTIALLSVHPVVTMFLVVFNPGQLFFGQEKTVPGPREHDFTTNVLFDVHTVYSYILVLGVAGLILSFVFRTNRTLYRGQAAVLLGAVIVPIPLNMWTVLGDVRFESTVLGFLVTFSLLTVATVRYDLINIAPVARDRVIETVRDGMFVLDTDDRIVDCNPAAKRITSREDETVVGHRFQEVFAELPSVVSDYEGLTETVDVSERTLSYGDLYMQVQATPLRDDRERHAGWLLLLQDVTEQRRRERDLEQQVEKLDQFARIVSHDLRNPINVAGGYIQQTKATGDLEHLEKTTEAIERMEVIIEDVLALAREGEDVTEPDQVWLAAIARRAWENVESPRGALEVEDDEAIVADATRLQRLFENLYRNSLEHGFPEATGAGSELTLTVGISAKSGTELTVYVADDGVGISEEDLEQVFEQGYTTNSEGTGLGLAIVDQIARAHGWEVQAVPSDDGARFEIRGVGRPRL